MDFSLKVIDGSYEGASSLDRECAIWTTLSSPISSRASRWQASDRYFRFSRGLRVFWSFRSFFMVGLKISVVVNAGSRPTLRFGGFGSEDLAAPDNSAVAVGSIAAIAERRW
jgi:hypothetical protein